MDNIEITPEELAFIRSLGDFDLTMFLSEINDHGWGVARQTLRMIRDAVDWTLAQERAAE